MFFINRIIYTKNIQNKLDQYEGYIIVGGASYEDRSRAGVIAAQDEIIKEIIIQSESGKPVLGICTVSYTHLTLPTIYSV